MPPTPQLRIIDASLNRASEGLRVVEDYVRFVLDDPFLTNESKSLRHDLAAVATAILSEDRHAARNTAHDVGTMLTAPPEQLRSSPWDVCLANLKRTEQSLRSLEEHGKLTDPAFAKSMESLRYRLYTLEKAIDVGRSSRDRLENAQLCVLIDGGETAAEFERLVRALVEAGVCMIQLRDKCLDDRQLLGRARILLDLTRKTRSLAVINDRADVAAAADADGIHIGQEDLPVKEVRTIVGTRMLIGVSTHNIEQARAAVLDGANYLGAGPTFPSQTKSFESFAGLDYLRTVSKQIGLPTFAIGGITATNLPDVIAAGITRVAVGSAVTAAGEPASAARRLLDMLK
jgi:thiamine-phosphate pyrophosphorylase